ncbi:MAG: class II aldolase/adducin family protein [Intestinibacillus sp.]
MFLEEKKEIIKGGIKLDRYGLIALSGGNLSARMPSGEILVTPSGMIYEDMEPDDVLVMDLDGKILEGTRKPSSDTEAILYIFQHRPDVNAVIHTHQPYATAVGLIEKNTFRVNLTTLANAAGGNVPITPFSAAGSIDMGIDTVKYIGDSLAVILAHHGVMTIGKDLKQALYAAVYMEEAAKCYLAAAAVGPTKQMSEAQIQQAVDVFKYYGQGTPTIPKELTERLG